MKHLIQQHQQRLDISSCFPNSAYLQNVETTLHFEHNNQRRMLIKATLYLFIPSGGTIAMISDNFYDHTKRIVTKVVFQIARRGTYAGLNQRQHETVKQGIKTSCLLITKNVQVELSKIYPDVAMYCIVAPVVLLAKAITIRVINLCWINGTIAAEKQQDAIFHCVNGCEPTAFVPNQEVFNA